MTVDTFAVHDIDSECAYVTADWAGVDTTVDLVP